MKTNNKKKRILFVVSTMTTGGINTSLSALYANLKNRYDINVFALDYDQTIDLGFKEALLPKDSFLDAYHCDYHLAKFKEKPFKLCVKILKKVFRIIGHDLQPFIFKRAVMKIEKNEHFDVIISFQEGQPTEFCSYFVNKNKIAWVHCDYVRYYKDAGVYQHYKKIVFVSDYTKKTFVKQYPEYISVSDYIYNFIDEVRIKKLSQERINDDRFTHDNFTILSMGRIVSLKRFSYIPQIASELKSKGYTFKWYILGPPFDTSETKLLEENILKFNVVDYVRWLGNKSNPYPYLANSSLLVALSTTEACPMMFIEAKTLNVPIVSTDFGSSFEFINNGQDGMISHIEGIGECIAMLIGDKIKYSFIKGNTLIFSYSNAAIIKKVVSILDYI